METQVFHLSHMPAVLWGAPCASVCLFLHGKGGSKEEAEPFAQIACGRGWQVLSIDLPEHGERKSEGTPLVPWSVLPELDQLLDYARSHWSQIALRATSIGAWFGMLAYQKAPLFYCAFLSPVVDMEALLKNMMRQASVTEEMLHQRGEIPTSFGEILSWPYFTFVKAHPILEWSHPTDILYGGKDSLISQKTVEDFCTRFGASLTIMEEGEHWFHTSQQLKVLEDWSRDHFPLIGC